jgi:hypothetical protein
MAARTESVSESVAEQPNEDVHAAENSTTASDKPMYTTPEWQRAPGRWSAKEAELLILMRSKVLHVTPLHYDCCCTIQRAISRAVALHRTA